MRRERYVIVAIVIIALTIVTVPYYHAFDFRSSTAVSQNQPALSPPMVPNPSYGLGAKLPGVNVTVLGVMKASVVAPTCSLSNPPCAILDTSIYYVVVNGRNYRLIFQNSTSIPVNVTGSNVVITGLYVTPSTFNADQWTPAISFYGDIYVQKVNFFLILPQ
jgi:hypothetical protein